MPNSRARPPEARPMELPVRSPHQGRAGLARHLRAVPASASRRRAIPCRRARQGDRRFAARGLPHRRIEEWKYTDLRALLTEACRWPASAAAPDRCGRRRRRRSARRWPSSTAYRLVFVDGEYAPIFRDLGALKAPASRSFRWRGARAADPGGAGCSARLNAAREDAVIALNTAFMTDGAVLRIAEGVSPRKPVHRVRRSTAPASRLDRHPHRGRRRRRGRAHPHREPMRPRPARPAAQYRDRASHSAQGAQLDHVKLQRGRRGTSHLATCAASRSAPTPLSGLPVHTGAQRRAQPDLCPLRRRGPALDISGALLCAAASTSTPRWWSITPCPAAAAASSSRACSTARRAASSRARSSSRPTRRRPTASRWRRRCCSRRRPSSTPSPSSRSSPTTSSAATARPRAEIDEELLFYLRSRGIPGAEAGRC